MSILHHLETPRGLLRSTDVLASWERFNRQYFAGRLPPIPIQWSGRLTSSLGLFMSRVGPRTNVSESPLPNRDRRCIRLSLPLIGQMPADPLIRGQLILNTLAHEMIHQWQYDILKRRPDHGPDFRKKMREINRQGSLSITIYHFLSNEVRALARHAWRCQWCGEVYRRLRRTIRPRLHICAICHGPLKEAPEQLDRHASSAESQTGNHRDLPLQQDPGVGNRESPAGQLWLPFEIPADPTSTPHIASMRDPRSPIHPSGQAATRIPGRLSVRCDP
ncbi:hypothetical protein DNFV4_04581 [Nitrospira tepida]|uniref:SprT-like domain-containing protein n=1 Tax=Nitrospira tepida TaxID=2973512 RepID=A0AA86N3V5_9BACT|nr:hypothetical protein DNFV4_04581 [Nitrospira tepida]